MPDVSDSPIAPTSMVLEIFTLIKRSVLAETHLPEDAAELVAFWTISTWFLDALTVLPCLVITGPAYDAMDVLHALSHFCLRSVRLAGGIVVLTTTFETGITPMPPLNVTREFYRIPSARVGENEEQEPET
jgi:hypothetical protein